MVAAEEFAFLSNAVDLIVLLYDSSCVPQIT